MGAFRNTVAPEWGLGVIVEEQPTRSVFHFENVGQKTFVRGKAKVLEAVELAPSELKKLQRRLKRKSPARAASKSSGATKEAPPRKTRTQLATLVRRHLEPIQKASLKPTKYVGGRTLEDGSVRLSSPNLSGEISAFVDECVEQEWSFPFDWVEFANRAKELIERDDGIEKAGLEELRRLLTVIIRQDRFASGVIAEMAERGVFLRILTRMAAIANDASDHLESRGEQAPRTVLEIGAEGGSLRIVESGSSPRRYSACLSDQSMTLLDGSPETKRQSEWGSWPAAVRLLGGYPWRHLYPLFVAPEFRKRVWRLIEEQKEQLDPRRLERWARLCGVDADGR